MTDQKKPETMADADLDGVQGAGNGSKLDITDRIGGPLQLGGNENLPRRKILDTRDDGETTGV